MADAVKAYEATLVGDQVPGIPGLAKWNGGVLAADGNIYGIPRDAKQDACGTKRLPTLSTVERV